MNSDIRIVQELVSTYQKNRDYMIAPGNKYNETSCRNEYIDPLLEAFGWDVHNKQGRNPQLREVIAEYSLSRRDRPDYSLTLNGSPRLFVEAKKPSVDILTDISPALQARKYGWNAGHKIVVLTNFENLIIYDTTVVPKDGDSPSIARYRIYNYTKYVSKFDEIAALISHNAVYSGDFDRFFDAEFSGNGHATESVDEYFLRQINEWRVSLANSLYSMGGDYCDLNILNDCVQEFINQIVFLRICEDRNLPLYHSLKENISDIDTLYTELDRMFREADDRYNSGLFSGKYIIFDLNDEVIADMIRRLYYPESPYLFNIISPGILGRMYEMFLTEELVLSDGSIILSPRRDCRNRSVVTTPEEIVRYMVDHTLTPLCDGKTPKQILDLHIADISCGSGIFLEEAFSWLQDYCVNWYLTNQKTYHLESIPGGRYKLPLSEKRELLTHCIYGIDIDIHAVEVARFSLLIKLIEDENTPSVSTSRKILPDLTGNIFYGNALVDNSFIAHEGISGSESTDIVPFDWEDTGVSRFDAIIGNPPYVSTSDMHNLLPSTEVDQIYKKEYKSAYKQFDKYFLFIERAISKVKKDGIICYIVPNKYIRNGSGARLRDIISSQKILSGIDDFGDAQLFSGKTTYSSILLLRNSKQDSFIYRTLTSIDELWRNDGSNSISIPESSIGSAPWPLTTNIDFMQFLNVLQGRSQNIEDFVNIFNGIQTSAERPKPVYWFSRSEISSEDDLSFTIERDSKSYVIEKAILRPYFKPVSKDEKGLDSYSILTTDKYIIFPYDDAGRLIPLNTMENTYPGAYTYLKDHYDILVPKSVSPHGTRKVPGATPDTWYQYGRSQALSAFTNTPKLIVGILSQNPMYIYDDKDMLIASGGTAGYCAITRKESSKYRLEYIQAWLTNPHTEKIIAMYGSDFENGFISRGTAVLKKLPFIPLDLNDNTQKKIYNDVVTYSQEIYTINDSLCGTLSKSSRANLMRRKDFLRKSITQLIDQVYEMRY